MENKLTLFAVKSTEPVEIVFEKTIDNIKEVNQKYVTLLLYECSDETNKKNYGFLLSLTTGATAVCSGSKENWFQIG